MIMFDSILLTVLYAFSFLSFNTRAMMPNDARLDDTAALVKAAGADFVFLTEEYTGQMTELLKNEYPYAESARAHIDMTERFYSKFPIVDVEDIGAIVNGDKRDVWVHRVRVVPHEGDTLSLYCCHLPHDYKARTDIVTAILEDIGRTGAKAVVGGDMNSLAVSAPIAMLADGGLTDCWTEKGRGAAATYHRSIIGARIDYIFRTSGLETTQMKRISAAGISDHDALFARFETCALRK